MYKILKPLIFKTDPEKIHNFIILLGRAMGFTKISRLLRLFFVFKNEMLENTILGIKFDNPLGLAAGFDKNAYLTNFMPDIGFGFEEIGSITGTPCKGNPKPRLFRLPEDKALAVNYGLCSEGAGVIAKKLYKKRFRFPLGVSIARSNNQEIVMDPKKGILDYLKAYEYLQNIGDYLTINISCPNTPDERAFSSPLNFDKLMEEFGKLEIKKPIFIKLKPDFSKEEINEFIKISNKYKFIKGFIISNLTKDKKGLKTSKKGLQKIKGSISGIPTQEKSNKLLRYVYEKTKGKYILIGCGGVFDAKDAYEKIKSGASLVQLITGMIYNGPGVIKKINRELADLLKKDGYKNINEAIGVNLTMCIKHRGDEK